MLARLDLGETALAVERDREGLRSAEARYEDLASGSRGPEIAAAEAEVRGSARGRRSRAAGARAAGDAAGEEGGHGPRPRPGEDGARARRCGAECERGEASSRRRGLPPRPDRAGPRSTSIARRSSSSSPRPWPRRREIRAPADGVILHRMAEPGLLLAAGQPALTMAFADRLYVRTFVPETQARTRAPGPEPPRSAWTRFRAGPFRRACHGDLAGRRVHAQGRRDEVASASTSCISTKVDLDAGWKDAARARTAGGRAPSTTESGPR